MFNDFINGFLLELSLVMTVGLQSAFILKQGIRREFVIIAVLTCFFSETLLVTIGIAGMGALVRSIPHLNQIITGIGIVFLFFYAAKSLYAAVKKNDYIIIDNEEKGLVSKKEVLLSGLAFALLNPHVIIDTTIMGSLAANFYPHHWVFGAGVISAAFVWYAFLGTVGATLAKPLNKPKTWKVINILIAVLCIYMASQFIQNFNNPNHEHSHINLFSVFGVDDSIIENVHNHEADDDHIHEDHNHDVNHNHNDYEHNDEHIHNEHSNDGTVLEHKH